MRPTDDGPGLLALQFGRQRAACRLVPARIPGRRCDTDGYANDVYPPAAPDDWVDLPDFLSFDRARITALLMCVAAGALCVQAGTPIPWMIGPLFAMALAKWRGVQVDSPTGFRGGGQLLIGTALGLYFTPDMLVVVARFLPWMVAAGLFAIVMAAVCARLLTRLAKPIQLDAATAFFACVPGGASEMANLAARHKGRQDLVVVAQSLRILVIVATIPFLYAYAGIHGADAYAPGAKVVDAQGLVQLLALAMAGAWAAWRMGVPNGFALGPLLATIVLTGSGTLWSAMPVWLVNFGQLMIGCSLGARFEQDFFRSAPRFLWAAAASTLLAFLLSSSFAIGMGWAAGVHWSTAILALAPGGMPEMSITAKVLQLGVPIVVAFHVTRMALLVTLSWPAYRLMLKVMARATALKRARTH